LKCGAVPSGAPARTDSHGGAANCEPASQDRLGLAEQEITGHRNNRFTKRIGVECVAWRDAQVGRMVGAEIA